MQSRRTAPPNPLLIEAMAKRLPEDLDLGDEREVIRALIAGGYSDDQYGHCIPAIIERARLLKIEDAGVSLLGGTAGFSAAGALICATPAFANQVDSIVFAGIYGGIAIGLGLMMAAFIAGMKVWKARQRRAVLQRAAAMGGWL